MKYGTREFPYGPDENRALVARLRAVGYVVEALDAPSLDVPFSTIVARPG